MLCTATLPSLLKCDTQGSRRATTFDSEFWAMPKLASPWPTGLAQLSHWLSLLSQPVAEWHLRLGR